MDAPADASVCFVTCDSLPADAGGCQSIPVDCKNSTNIITGTT